VLADINIQGGATVAGVVQTTTGGTNTLFATTGLLGDSNLLQHAIQNAVFGTTPSLSLDITRMAGVLNSRTDLDQSQFPSDVSPRRGASRGIYDVLLPLLQQWKQQYGFVGSFFANNRRQRQSGQRELDQLGRLRTLLQGDHRHGQRDRQSLPIPTSSIRRRSTPTAIRCPTTVVNGQTVSTWNENTNTLYIKPASQRFGAELDVRLRVRAVEDDRASRTSASRLPVRPCLAPTRR